jgi:hypothetical protein
MSKTRNTATPKPPPKPLHSSIASSPDLIADIDRDGMPSLTAQNARAARWIQRVDEYALSIGDVFNAAQRDGLTVGVEGKGH